MNLTNVKKWTKEEDKFLEENYKSKGAWYCAENLERNFNSVTKRYARIFIKKETKIIKINKEVWSYDKCKEEALKYKTKNSFIRVNNPIYKYIIENNWTELLSHIPITEPKPSGYWTYERCKEEALKYNSMVDFKKKCISAFNSVNKNKWVENLCTHMESEGNLFKRMVYVYIFSDNHCYVGLTYNRNKRKCSHNHHGLVFDHGNKTGLKPEYKELSDFIDAKEAIKLEKFYIKEYQNNGYILLNKSSGGQLGGNTIKWTYENIKEEVAKYKNISGFSNECSGAYNAAIKNGWINEFFPDNKIGKSKIIKKYDVSLWDYERCKEEALKYKNKTEFMSNCNKGYTVAKKNGWLYEWFPLGDFKVKRKWNHDLVKLEAKKYNGKNEFRKNVPMAYKLALKNGYLNELFPNNVSLKKEWSLEKVLSLSKKYKNRTHFRRHARSALIYVLENNLMDFLYPLDKKLD